MRWKANHLSIAKRCAALVGLEHRKVGQPAVLGLKRCDAADPFFSRPPETVRNLQMVGFSLLWSRGGNLGLPPSGYVLSLGRITDTLRTDHESFFQRPPDFGIYAEDIAFSLSKPQDGRVIFHGKRKYEHVMTLWRGVTCRVVADGEVQFRILKADCDDHALKVRWSLRGTMVGIQSPVFVDAISLYSVGPAPSFQDDPLLTHKVNRHTVEFVEVHPPCLRDLIFSTRIAALA